jgi:hypothetical protein
MVVGFTTTYAITTKVVSLNPVHGEVYSIQHYVIKFVCDLRQVGDFLWFLPPIKLKVVLDTIKPTNLSFYVNEVDVLHSFLPVLNIRFKICSWFGFNIK